MIRLRLSIFAFCFLASGALPAPLLAVPLEEDDYPGLGGNIQVGCDGVEHCIVVFHGAGSTNLENIQEDLRVLTRTSEGGFPSTWGIQSFRASGLTYSGDDIVDAAQRVAPLSQEFGPRLHTVWISDGVRVGRILGNNGVFQSQVGLWAEVEPFAPFPLERLDPNPNLHYLALVSYYGEYTLGQQIFYGTGPADVDTPAFPFYPIALDRIAEGEAVFDFHGATIPLGRDAVYSVLLQLARDDVPMAIRVLRAQKAGERKRSANPDGGMGMSSPPVGSEPGVPTDGGGMGVESFPSWLVTEGGTDASRSSAR